MNYFVPSLLVLPLLVSCDVVQVDNYGPSYYTHSHPQVEVETRYVTRQARVHGHPDRRNSSVVVNPRNSSRAPVHGHNEVNRPNVNARPANAPQPQSRVNAHGPNEEERDAQHVAQSNVHGH